MSVGRYRHYGWLVSPYSAKTRAYLTFKQAPFDDIAPTGRMMAWTIRRAVGRVVMPTVRKPDGTWLQDTSEIIDTLEQELEGPSITPPGPTQRLASLLLELHGDEWLPLVAMHSRWTIAANEEFARSEFGRNAFPLLPAALGRKLAASTADRMASYLPRLGVHPGTSEGIQRFGDDLIERLDAHLAQHPFLLGTRPCLGDFALYGPLWAHTFRDPGSTSRFDDAPHVRGWFDRLAAPPEGPGEFLADDVVPASLDAIFQTLFEEQFTYVADLVGAIDRWCDDHPDATRVPRSLGDCSFRVGGAEGERRLITFIAWMAQRPLDAYAGLTGDAREATDHWLARVGGAEAMRLTVRHRQVRRHFKMGLEKTGVRT